MIICPLLIFWESDFSPTPNTSNPLPKLSLIHLNCGLCMHALHNEVGCLRVVTMAVDELKRQQLRGSSFGIATDNPRTSSHVMVAGDSLTNVCS